jgi:hypothetical protein
MDALRTTLDEIRGKASELRESFGDEPRARALEWAAAQVEATLRQLSDESLTLAEASRRSGYSPDHLGRLLREHRLPNAGRTGAPRIRAGDLPTRVAGRVAPPSGGGYDPVADARALLGRRGGTRA